MSTRIDKLEERIDNLKKVVIVSQLGTIYEVYGANTFIDMVNDLYIDNGLDDNKDDLIYDLDEAIEWYVDKQFADDCLTVDVFDVIEDIE